jgi:starch phosphorylase
MLVEAANQVAPVVSEARTLDRFIARRRNALVAGAQPVVELGSRLRQPVSRSESDALEGAESESHSLLSEMPLGEIERRATELVLHSRINYCYRRQQEYLNADRTWGATNAGVLRPRPVAYFSAEFGLHESLPIYSGGLGVLAGDHIKSASDLDIPLIGVGCSMGRAISCSGWTKTAGSRRSICRPT